MTVLSVRTVLAATWLATWLAAIPALAQSPAAAPPAGGRAPTVQHRWPESATPPQAAPAPPQSQAQPAAPKRQPAARPGGPWIADEEPLPPTAEQKPAAAPRAPASVVACNGVFAKDSAHLKLALKYDSRNVSYGQVDGPEGTKLNASILYPNDPRRRLEVVWSNDAARSDVSVIAINGKSQWVAPKGLKLGLALAALEKANGKPFKLSGFGADGSASVLGWEGGALSALPGGCKVGMRLLADSKSPEEARSAVAGNKEFLSSDASVRALKPTVGEIFIGY
jgi:hypothetical protein